MMKNISVVIWNFMRVSADASVTTRDRVEQQLDATALYVQGAIGYQWSGPTAMSDIDHIGDGTCSAGPGELNSGTS